MCAIFYGVKCMNNNEYYIKKALELAYEAYQNNEIPVGAIIVKDDIIIGSAYNSKDKDKIVTKHAELLAIENASKHLGDWRLNGCTIYVTMEPCPMCASAIQQARVDKLVYGCSSNIDDNNKILYSILQNSSYNHTVKIEGKILEEECSKLIKDFFALKR